MNASEIKSGKLYCSKGKKKVLRSVASILDNYVVFLEQSIGSYKTKMDMMHLLDFAEWADGEIEKLQ